MKEIFDFIQRKNQTFAQLPLFDFLRDTSIHPRKRLSYAPIIVPLAIGFGELCNTVFREEPTNNKVQELINQHTYEEHFHWQWLLEDIEKLNLNSTLTLTDAMKFLWGENTKKSREICSKLERYTFQADPIIKLTVIQVGEVTANVFFKTAKPVALELQAMTGKEYRYFGMCHLDKEDNHNLNSPEVVSYLEQISLTNELKQNALDIANSTFQDYTDVVNEMMAFATKQDLE